MWPATKLLYKINVIWSVYEVIYVCWIYLQLVRKKLSWCNQIHLGNGFRNYNTFAFNKCKPQFETLRVQARKFYNRGKLTEKWISYIVALMKYSTNLRSTKRSVIKSFCESITEVHDSNKYIKIPIQPLKFPAEGRSNLHCKWRIAGINTCRFLLKRKKNVIW